MHAEPRQFAHREILVIIGGLLTGMALAGLDSTIVATSLPTIVGELGGLDHISWVVTAYLLAETVTVPLYGKLSDLFGRPALFRIAIVIFVAGSMLCGLAQNLPMLVLFRGIQGLGAGGLISMTFAIMGDVIPPRERGRYTGYLGSVFAVTSVVGPLLGGFLTDHVSWRWIFYVNVPVGAVALVVTAKALRLPKPERVPGRRIDFLGAALLVVGVAAVLLGLEWGGTEHPWGSPLILALLAGGSTTVVAFIAWERRVEDPILPLRLFRNDIVSVAGAMAFLAGVTMYGGIIYLPLFLQVVKGVSASSSGLLLVPLMVGVLCAAIPVGRLITRTGRYKFTGPVGFGSLMVSGGLLALTMHVSTPLPVTFGLMAAFGLGVGTLSPPLTLAVQNAVERSDLGAATATNMFLRNLGGSVGVAVFGSVFAGRIGEQLVARLPSEAVAEVGGDVTGLLREPSAIAGLPGPVADAIRGATANSLQVVFLGVFVAAIIGLVVSLRLREIPLRSAADFAGQRRIDGPEAEILEATPV